MEGKLVQEHTFRRKDQAITLATKTSSKATEEEIHVDPQLLFQRLVAAGRHQEDLPEIFAYELCTYPPALFESRHMPLEANKATLAEAMWSSTNSGEPTGKVQYVVDGGSVLHRVSWSKGCTWEDILHLYTNYVTKRYDKAIVVFDGYNNGPQTKDCTHLRRTGGSTGPVVNFTVDMVVQSKKNDFLSNPENKNRLIHLLMDRFQRQGCETYQARADADLLIVQTTIAAAGRCDTVLIGEDTDLLVLLCHHAQKTPFNIFFRSGQKSGMKTKPRSWDVRATRRNLGEVLCENMLFIHALLGCDTTSRVHGIGKRVALTLARNSPYFREQSQVFYDETATKEQIISAGENALVAACNGKPGQSINDLRFQRFCVKASSYTTASVKPQSLPPSEAATRCHSLRVFYQVQEWRGRGEELDPEDWGWKIRDGRLIPTPTHLDAAPQTLLKVIRCNCRTGCNSMRCSCRKNGIECSTACGECRGVCENGAPVSNFESDHEVPSDDEE